MNCPPVASAQVHRCVVGVCSEWRATCRQDDDEQTPSAALCLVTAVRHRKPCGYEGLPGRQTRPWRLWGELAWWQVWRSSVDKSLKSLRKWILDYRLLWADVTAAESVGVMFDSRVWHVCGTSDRVLTLTHHTTPISGLDTPWHSPPGHRNNCVKFMGLLCTVFNRQEPPNGTWNPGMEMKVELCLKQA